MGCVFVACTSGDIIDINEGKKSTYMDTRRTCDISNVKAEASSPPSVLRSAILGFWDLRSAILGFAIFGFGICDLGFWNLRSWGLRSQGCRAVLGIAISESVGVR